MESFETVPSADWIPLVPVSPPARRTGTAPVSASHTCQFYESDDFLSEAVARFAAEGMRSGQPVLLVTTPDHRDRMALRLAAEGIDFEDAVQGGQIRWADARATLGAFMDGPVPDRQRFGAALEGMIATITTGPLSGRPRIFGEMVDVLWRDGNPAAALRLEELWNELAETHPFELLCGYSLGNFHRAADASHFEEVCAHHARAIPTGVFALTRDEAARDREISLLQQRARALEAEMDHRRELEEALLLAKDQAERAARAKSEFLALMSHELRTPLNAIIGYQDLLEHGVGGSVSGEQRAYLSRMRSCSHQLLRLIDQVLNLARVETTGIELDKDVVSALSVARETASLVEPSVMRKGLTLDVRAVGTDVTLVTDAGTLRQILLNLLTNAIKFTDGGGIQIAVKRQESAVAFHVVDTGIGIRLVDQERIFEPFVQVDTVPNRRFGGSGLGLAVSRDLACLLGGTLTLVSQPGEGSAFTLTLPISPPVPAES